MKLLGILILSIATAIQHIEIKIISFLVVNI